MPWIPLPIGLVYAVAYILEILHYSIGTDPVITRNEMVKVLKCSPFNESKKTETKHLGYESSLL